jgi:nicotinamidase-related amidase
LAFLSFLFYSLFFISMRALPYPYSLPTTPSQLALVIIDMQRDFLEPGGFGDALGNDVSRLRTIVPPLKRLLETFRELNLPIVHTLECHKPDLSDCPPSKRNRGHSTLQIGDEGPMGRILVLGEPGNAIIPELAPIPGEMVITKPGKGAFYNTPLESLLNLKGITHLLITGVTTEVCVQTTMREANDRGYECLMVEDCTESYFPEFKQATLEMVRAQGGIVGWTATSADVLEAFREWTAATATSPVRTPATSS